MIITVNGFTLNDPTSGSGCYLDEPVDGLGLPQMRTSSGNYSGRDGGYVGAQFYSVRLLSLTGHMFGADAPGLDTIRKNLAAAVASSPIIVNITTNGGAMYTLTAYLDTLDMPISQAPNVANYKLSLIAPDPNIYDNSSGGALSTTVPLTAQGGLRWPITWPIQWLGGSGATTVTNTGNVAIYPKIVLTNVMTNPTITNSTTGQFFTLQGLTTVAGDVVTIDMLNRTVLLNGGSVLAYMTSTSSWWPLLPGGNSISLTTVSSGDTVTANVTWRPAYRGI
jgi:hypothetical protein